jgi:DNA polymerase V
MSHNERATGFPSPAQGYEAKSFDFNELLIRNPPATFVMRAECVPFPEQGVVPGSLLIIDRSVAPGNGSLVIIQHAGEFMCRQMIVDRRKVLFAGGREYIGGDAGDVEVFGTVRAVVTLL